MKWQAVLVGAGLLALERVSRTRDNGDRVTPRELFGSNLEWALRGLHDKDLPIYGVSYSDVRRMGPPILGEPHYPRGVWFYSLVDPEWASVKGVFATDRTWINLIRLREDTTFFVRTPEDTELLRSFFVKNDPDTLGPNRRLLAAGYRAVVDLAGRTLPVEYPQGVVTWPGGGEITTSYRNTRQPNNDDARRARALRRLHHARPGSLKISPDVLEAAKEWLHLWDWEALALDALLVMDLSDPETLSSFNSVLRHFAGRWNPLSGRSRWEVVTHAENNPTLPAQYREFLETLHERYAL